MEFKLPELGKQSIPLPHFPTRYQAFIYRAWEYVPPRKIAEVLGCDEEKVVRSARDMGLGKEVCDDLWLAKGYITIIRRMWHILPYQQLLELLETDEQTLAVTLREDDFLDIKLGDKPRCEQVEYRELTEAERGETAKIKKIMDGIDLSGARPFDFKYNIPQMSFSGDEVFDTRMIYAFSGLYQNAFDVDSRVYCPDEMLEAYSKLGVNAIWTQGILFQLSEFPFAPSISAGWQKRLENMKDFADRLSKYGMKLFLYLNEPRCMPESFFENYSDIKGHKMSEEKVCFCISTEKVQKYLTDAVEGICRAVPDIGGFFTITRSENPTNCYSHADYKSDKRPCTCPRCSEHTVAEVVCDTVKCFREGADRVNRDIKVIAWDWAWYDESFNIIDALPERVIVLAQSELAMPAEIGGVNVEVIDYSMSIVGPGENAKGNWRRARARGLETGAKIQVNTTWEASTVPALPVYPSIEKHMRDLRQEGVSHLLLSWTLGGYPSRSIAHAAKYFYEKCEMEDENSNIKEATELFTEAFSEFPFHLDTLYFGPQNAGPSSMLFDEPTGYEATMTCFAYDDLDKWRSVYPAQVFQNQFEKLCCKWRAGLDIIKDEPECETTIMAHGAYCLFKSSLDQIKFYRAREAGNRNAMLEAIKAEKENAHKMLELMNKDASIGYEAANHYYFSKGQIAEKIVNCEYLIRKYS